MRRINFDRDLDLLGFWLIDQIHVRLDGHSRKPKAQRSGGAVESNSETLFVHKKNSSS